MKNLPYAIAEQFSTSVLDIAPLGNGLINDTFWVKTESMQFVMQRINSTVFPKPLHIMDNLLQLNQHLQQNPNRSVKLKIPALLKTLAHNDFYLDEQNNCWRAMEYIENTECLEVLANEAQAQQVGLVLGYFHCLLSDLIPSQLHDTLPGFHIAPEYLKSYQRVLTTAFVQSEPDSLYCAEFIARYKHLAVGLEAAKAQGLLTLRVIHGDPKLNNFLFDKACKKIISLIDLDTIKPGLVHYDIGDCLRSCCHKLGSNEFDLELCAIILESYLSEAGAFFSAYDYDYLYTAIQVLPFELGLRFYTDFLDGNRYFKVTDPKQNLNRAVAQFKLCESIIDQELAIKTLIKQLRV
jgi:Ser/Thr protein kinase RdoA (MazF antagonist)